MFLAKGQDGYTNKKRFDIKKKSLYRKLKKKEGILERRGEQIKKMFSFGQRRKENDPKEEDSSLMSSRMALNDHKAGMQNLDREKINQIIFEASKGE